MADPYRIAACWRFQAWRLTTAVRRQRIILFLMCHRWWVGWNMECFSYPCSILYDFICHTYYTTQNTENATSHHINPWNPETYIKNT